MLLAPLGRHLPVKAAVTVWVLALLSFIFALLVLTVVLAGCPEGIDAIASNVPSL